MLNRISIILLVFISTACVAADETAMFPDSGPWGVQIHHPLRDGLKEIGVQWVRLDFRWPDIEYSRRGEYVWEDPDVRVDYYRQRGFHILGLLSAENLPVMYHDDRDKEDVVIAAFVKQCKAAAERYKGKVELWEILNEPELFAMGGYWNNPVIYTKMARQAAAAIKAVDPDVRVGALCTAWMDRGFITIALEAGLLNDGNIDVVTFHGYHRANLMAESGLAEDVTWLRDLIKRTAPDQHIIVVDSERGYAIDENRAPKFWGDWRNTVYTESAQAAYLARHYLEHIWLGTEIIIWYKDMQGESRFSLYYGYETDAPGLRPMGDVYRNLAALLPDNPQHERNDSYAVTLVDLPDSLPDPNATVALRTYLRKYTEDGHEREKLIIAAWHPIEAFDGKILENRTREGDNYVEVWRDIKEDDHVNVPTQFRIVGMPAEKVLGVNSYDLLSKVTAMASSPINATHEGGSLVTSTVRVGPMPTILVVDLQP